MQHSYSAFIYRDEADHVILYQDMTVILTVFPIPYVTWL